MANNTNINDFSDINFTPPTGDKELSPTQLPIRGEFRFIPKSVSPPELSFTKKKVGAELVTGSIPTSEESFAIAAALKPFTDFVVIRIPHRGLNLDGTSDSSLSAYYRFLINPSTVNISRSTLDAQAMTRGGWQFGVWGENFAEISLSGKTAGQYFSNGLTDYFQQFTLSYRNLQQLNLMFSNNGYFFEGEQVNEGVLAGDQTRRRIKLHQDITLMVGNFIWSGMFETLRISQDASNPYLADFSLTFVMWKERFRSTSPYKNSGATDVERGHSYAAADTTNKVQQAQINAQVEQNLEGSDIPFPDGEVLPRISPAQQVGSHLMVPIIDPTLYDASPVTNIIYSSGKYWNGFD